MNYGPLLFLGAFLTLSASWCGLILVPQLQIGRQVEVVQKFPLPNYPPARPGMAQQGREVYRSLGCAECHTQQVRPADNNTDLARGWGVRRTVAQDFMADNPVMLGSLRIGPDLANLATRSPAAFAVPWKFLTDTNHEAEAANWHLRHLYDPRTVSPGSLMPAYRFLFIERDVPVGREPAADALLIKSESADGSGRKREVIPTPRAHALVAYLMSLKADAPLYEAPLPRAAETKPAAGDTNAPAAVATNSPPSK